jgi:hypothetical protein
VGAALLTHQCSSDPKMSKSLGDGNDDFANYPCSIRRCIVLMKGDYNGALLKAMIVEQETIKLTEPHSKEWIKWLWTKAAMHNARPFYCSGKTESEKEMLVAMKIQQAANEIIQQKPNKFKQLHFSSLTVVGLDTLLSWYNQYSTKMLKQEKIVKLTAAVTSNWETGVVEEWTAEDEAKLQQLMCLEVDMADMAL